MFGAVPIVCAALDGIDGVQLKQKVIAHPAKNRLETEMRVGAMGSSSEPFARAEALFCATAARFAKRPAAQRRSPVREISPAIACEPALQLSARA